MKLERQQGHRLVSQAFSVTVVMLLIVSAAVALRFYYVSRIEYHVARSDAADYINYGYNLVFRGVYSRHLTKEQPPPDSLRSPGYPLFVAVGFLLGGKEHFVRVVFALQSIMGGFLVLCTVLLGRRFLPVWWAVAAALLVALSPHQVTLTGYFLTEILYSFVLLVGLLCLVEAHRRQNLLGYGLAGIGFGIAYLVNETCLPLVFFLVLILLSVECASKESMLPYRWWRLGIFLLVFVCFPAVWMARNAFHLPEGAETGSKRALATLAYGSYPGFIYKSERYRYYPYREDPEQPVFASSLKNFTSIFWRRFKARPWRYLTWYIFEKPYYLWSWSFLQGRDIYIYQVNNSPYDQPGIIALTKSLMQVIHPFLMLLVAAGCGLIILLSRHSGLTGQKFEVLLIYGILLYVTMLCMVFAPLPRYAVPYRPEFYLAACWVAAAGVNSLSDRFSKVVPAESGGHARTD
jgi:hypothetical protein